MRCKIFKPSNPSGPSNAYKRWFDICVILIAHITIFPIWIVIWLFIPLLIWLEDRGPIFYRQKRVGKDGHVFVILKFRTMIEDAYKFGPAWTLENDPRVTKVGRVLRRTALDELPEIFSILKGDMSFVGPRALDVEEHNTLESEIPHFNDRLKVLPGLTGMSQIYNQKDDPQYKFKYDIEYIGKMNLWLDIRLIILSIYYTFTARWDNRGAKTGHVLTKSNGENVPPVQDAITPDDIEDSE